MRMCQQFINSRVSRAVRFSFEYSRNRPLVATVRVRLKGKYNNEGTAFRTPSSAVSFLINSFQKINHIRAVNAPISHFPRFSFPPRVFFQPVHVFPPRCFPKVWRQDAYIIYSAVVSPPPNAIRRDLVFFNNANANQFQFYRVISLGFI